jgi:hypothetical protein
VGSELCISDSRQADVEDMVAPVASPPPVP